MSAAPARAPRTVPAPQAAPRVAPRRDHLRAVATPQQARSLGPFVALCLLVVAASLATVLMLNTMLTSGSYDVRALRSEIAQLHQERAALLTELESSATPGALAGAAAELGMEPAGRVGFISLEDEVVREAGA